jgi:hypothetical protein
MIILSNNKHPSAHSRSTLDSINGKEAEVQILNSYFNSHQNNLIL